MTKNNEKLLEIATIVSGKVLDSTEMYDAVPRITTESFSPVQVASTSAVLKGENYRTRVSVCEGPTTFSIAVLSSAGASNYQTNIPHELATVENITAIAEAAYRFVSDPFGMTVDGMIIV